MSRKHIQKTPVSNGRTSDFISEVKAWVESSGMTQRELAKKLGVSYQLITEWFAGRKFPVGEEILHLQELMGRRKKH